MIKIQQSPAAGQHKLFFCGDIINFQIKLETPPKGKAFIRTNIARAKVQRKEIITRTLEQRVGSAQDWRDIPMVKVNDKLYSIDIALTEVGHFEAVCYFLPKNTTEPVWPGSDNVSINVEPSEYCCANSIYCAFPRQFGPNKYYSESKSIAGLTDEKMLTFDQEGFTVIPPSGTFRDLIKELDFIIHELNCRIIHLLPITPTPTVYARMGRYGSPYASLDFTNIDPSLAEFDKTATPLEQFLELVDEIHHRNAKVIIDVAINHTGWAAKVHEEHPEWLLRDKDGTIISPGAWGTIWGDLTELDHTNNPELREYLADMFLTWTERGIDGFRCDAGYMIPFDVWEYIIAKVKDQYPDTIFLLEGLGGDVNITLNLLNKANMNWAYSELFQNYTKEQIVDYITSSQNISSKDGLMVHYAETHDNSRLAATSDTYSKMRTGLCALLSSGGAFGFTNGVEWFAKEKIDVHEARALNWGNKKNQVQYISRINTILINHPAFHWGSKIIFLETDNDNLVSALREDKNKTTDLLILINLDCENTQEFKYSNLNFNPGTKHFVYDLISEEHFSKNITENTSFKLKPGQVLCLTENKIELETTIINSKIIRPDIIDIQRAKALALELICWKNKSNAVTGIDTETIHELLFDNPLEFCKNLYPRESPAPIIQFNWPIDTKRKVMIPPDHLIYVTAPHRFRVYLKHENNILVQHYSLQAKNGVHFTFLRFDKKVDVYSSANIKMNVYGDEKCVRTTSEALLLPRDFASPQHRLSATEIRKYAGTFLDTNSRGGMLRPCLKWGELNDKYNCILGANTSTTIPVDRQIMFTRIRAWVLRQGRSQELNISTTHDFFINTNGGGTWTFHVPVGNGLYVDYSLAMTMLKEKNAVKLSIFRHPSKGRKHYLRDDEIVNFILRPDIEDRNFHHNTKATDELKEKFKNAVKPFQKGFSFAPSQDRTLRIISSKGFFGLETEWKYSISRKTETERGFQEHSDLFSPGYFNIDFTGGEHAEISSQVLTKEENEITDPLSLVNYKYLLKPSHSNLEKEFKKAIDKFIVRRDNLKTVIAGYPWFLDWGRDTLICARGLITAEKFKEVREILLQFATFSKDGILPNIIYGDTVGNWDTSDAPLWFIIACKDYCETIGDFDLLNISLKNKSKLMDTLDSIINGYIKGTPNGIKMDPKSKLIFSPSHFTWMDTNYPAGTPREGYPIEIQALWFASLQFIGEISGNKMYTKLADQVSHSIEKYFTYKDKDEKGNLTGKIWLSDCLHCSSAESAEEAEADDHIRPNQLYAITLGALKNIETSKAVIETCSKLLVPGAIRTLDDRNYNFKLPVYGNDGKTLLNNPQNPYFGKYEGDEDTKRKAAYHNGTAWTLPFPLYPEAYHLIYGAEGKKHALSILSSSELLFKEGSFYQLPEIIDGDYPHKQRGCDAQAWGVTELYRVWKLLKKKDDFHQKFSKKHN